jgi:hypothetical protein
MHGDAAAAHTLQAGTAIGFSVPGRSAWPDIARFPARSSAGKGGESRDFAGMLVFDKWTRNSNGRQTLFRRTQDFVATAKQKPGKSHQAFIFFHIKLNTDN